MTVNFGMLKGQGGVCENTVVVGGCRVSGAVVDSRACVAGRAGCVLQCSDEIPSSFASNVCQTSDGET